MENNLKNLINLVANEDLAKAQTVVKEKLNKKLNEALKQKFDLFAPSIFEAAKPDFLDLDKDGDTTESMKQAARQAKEGDNENVEEDEEQSDSEEEEESEDEENDQKLEENEDSEDEDEEEEN